MTGVVAVHLGAGMHKKSKHKRYNKLARAASKAGAEKLKAGATALEAVKSAVMVLEDDPLTNSGFGSSLTLQGFVETDASIMDGKTLLYGGCGAIRKVKNPIELAYDICIKQSQVSPLGLVQPSLLVGNGGLLYAKQIGLKIVNNKSLVSDKAYRQHCKYKTMLDSYPQPKRDVLDTVGAVCVDKAGHVAAAASSGGLLLKKPGRVGQAALYASGVWADSFTPRTETSVAVCTTGCGEQLVQTQLAREIGTDLKKCSFPTTGLHDTILHKFVKSRFLDNVEPKMAGALVMNVSKNGEGSLLWGHTTESMSIGYMMTSDEKPKAIISEFSPDANIGSTVNIGGVDFSIT